MVLDRTDERFDEQEGRTIMARAIIGKTAYDSFGIIWRDFPYMERRGGYSGPFATRHEAEQRAREWTDMIFDGSSLTIENVESIENVDLPKVCAFTGQPDSCDCCEN
jgi:hypothetical protein